MVTRSTRIYRGRIRTWTHGPVPRYMYMYMYKLVVEVDSTVQYMFERDGTGSTGRQVPVAGRVIGDTLVKIQTCSKPANQQTNPRDQRP